MVSVFQKKETRAGGFTMAEMLVSIVVSSILIAGASFFVSEAYVQIISANRRVDLGAQITAFSERMERVRNAYSRETLLVDTADGYDLFLFTNSGSQKGALMGVADLSSAGSGGTYLPDAPGNFATYGKKVPFVQDLAPEQLRSVLASPSNAYSVAIRPDSAFDGLTVKEFSITPYESGSVFELSATYFLEYFPDLSGTPVSNDHHETVHFVFHF